MAVYNIMKSVLVFLALVAVAHGSLEGGLRVKFDVGSDFGSTFFFNVPRTVSEAVSEGWRKARRPAGPLPELVMYCPNDRVLCALYDDTDFIAGLQIAMAIGETSAYAFDWATQGFTKWNTAVNGACKKFWTTQQYFVSEGTLRKSKEERLAARDATKTLQEGAVWVTGINHEIVKISTSGDDISNSIFTKQACLAWMGQHYYYNMTATTPCTAEGMFPWFPMTQSGELIATGFMNFSQMPATDEARDWFERPDRATVQTIVPNGPQCLYDLVDSGTITMHIYYVDTPWQIAC